MVGPMMLLKMLHCQRINAAEKNKNIVQETGEDVHSDSSQYGNVPNNKVKKEFNEELYMDILCNSEQTCRVCLQEGDIPIYGDVVYDDNSEELQTLGGIEISLEDCHPKFLCQSCNSLLQGAILLRKTAQQSNTQLKLSEKSLIVKKTEDPDYSVDMDSPIDNEDNKRNEQKMYQCTLCTAKFKSVKSYKKHNNTKHGHNSKHYDYKIKKNKIKVTKKTDYLDSSDCKTDEKKKYNYCSKCKLTFNSFKEYDEHRMSEEHENMRHVCPICNQSYTTLYYKKHLLLHKSEALYMCDICGKKFMIQGQLIRHRLTHFNELPFKCSLCPYKGRFRESLRMHMRSHTGEKPYQCTQCPSRFTNKSNLNHHMRTHKGQHDFKCDTCGRGFYTKRELELHFKVDHTGIKEHICAICGKAFGYRKQMMKHQVKVHKREKMKSGRTALYLKIEKMKQLKLRQNVANDS